MKNLKKAILLLFCTFLAATTLTSCLSDDKDNNDSNIINLTGAQRTQTLQSLAGDYSGFLYFYNGTKKDSVEFDWNVSSSDSTFTSTSFPISFLQNYVTTNSNIKDAVTNAGRQPLVGSVNTYAQAAKTYWEQNYYFYLMTPANKTLKFIYNGKDCTITFDDYQTSSYGYIYPQIQYYNKKSSINFLVKNIKVGDDQMDVNTAFQAVGSR
ncbi:MAG: DUF4840 domain-containing protein [Prevotella sp.]|jgi:hypothetical protein|nr:DUF4840 domain-containing protein [Prevotella sp.]